MGLHAVLRGELGHLELVRDGIVRLEVVRRSGLADRLGRERLLFNARAAIARYQALPTEPQ